jgi:uncharacterized protein (DUF433 family)
MTLPIVLVPHPHVRIDQKVLGGSPFVEGSRVPVRRLWGFYRNGVNVETLLKRFPQLSAAAVLDALAFALDNEAVMDADLAREEALMRRNQLRRAPDQRQVELPFAVEATPRTPARPGVRRAAPRTAAAAQAALSAMGTLPRAKRG